MDLTTFKVSRLVQKWEEEKKLYSLVGITTAGSREKSMVILLSEGELEKAKYLKRLLCGGLVHGIESHVKRAF